MRLTFLSEAEWLDTGRIRGYLRLVALINIVTFLVVVGGSTDGVDAHGFLLGTDFLSFWTAGHMLVGHGNVYDIAAHIAAQRSFFPDDTGYTAFFHPPPFLLFCYPLGPLPYFPALGLWLLTTGAFFAFAARRWLGRRPPGLPVWLLFLAFPPVLITILHGQSSFLAAALLGLGAGKIRERPWLAGALFGLAIFKPQLGLLVSVVLLATRQWRPLFGAAISATLLSLAVTILFGPRVWADWLAVSGFARQAMVEGAMGFAKMQSPFGAAMLLGAPPALALALQTVIALAVAASLAWVGWKRGYSPALAAAMLAGAPLVTPFVFDYDLVLLAFPLAWLAARTPRPWEKVMLACVFIFPALARPLATMSGLAPFPLLLAGLFVLLIRRANDPADAETSGGAVSGERSRVPQMG